MGGEGARVAPWGVAFSLSLSRFHPSIPSSLFILASRVCVGPGAGKTFVLTPRAAVLDRLRKKGEEHEQRGTDLEVRNVFLVGQKRRTESKPCHEG